MEMLGSLLSSGISAVGNYLNTQQNNQFQQQLLNQQEQFSERMSNTAYQRASTDMKAAGLNPMMMFGSGGAASTPAAPSAQPQQSSARGIGDALANIIPSAVAMKTANATIDNLVAQNAKIKAETLTEGARTGNVMVDTGLKHSQTDRTVQETTNQRAVLHSLVNEAQRSDNELALRKTEAGKLLDQAGLAGRKVNDVISPVTNMVSTAKGVKSLMPSRSTVERTRDDGSSSFEERFHY